MRGKFITVEGGEGSGKSTQARRLAARLAALERPHRLVREPGGTPLAEAVRGWLLDSERFQSGPEVELLLYAAARADHVRSVIEPALASGEHVVCDRFSDSTIAYQGNGRGLPMDVVRGVDAVARGGLRPDATLLLDVPVELGLARARSRNAASDASGGPDEGRFEAETVAFHRRVRSGFLRLAGEEPQRVWVIDASREPDDVARRVETVLARCLPEVLGGAND